MYAIVEMQGKQHRVSTGEVLKIELLSNAQKGDVVNFDKVLMIGGDAPKIGKPFVANAEVSAVVTNMGKEGTGVKAQKVLVFKKKRRKGYHKMIGHRQRYTEIKIEAIKG